MKKIISILGIVFLLVMILINIPRTKYYSGPGFTTREVSEKFSRDEPKCIGISKRTNPYKDQAVIIADAPTESICYGWLSGRHKDKYIIE